MLFLLIVDGGAWAADGSPPQAGPVSPSGQSVHRAFVENEYSNIHGNKIRVASNEKAPMAYFLDKWPVDFDPTKLPSEATDVVIAKVRATESASSLVGRDQLGVPATDLPRDKLFIRVRILEIRLGNAVVGGEYAIYFGESGRDLMYPLTRDQLHRDYAVVMYRDSLDGKNRLVGFPIGRKQFLEWLAEVSTDRRSIHKN